MTLRRNGTIRDVAVRIRSWIVVAPEKAPSATLLLRLIAAG